MSLNLKNRCKKIFQFSCRPLPIWAFLALLIFLIFIQIHKQTSFFDFLTYVISTIFGGFVTYVWQEVCEKNNQQKREINASYHIIRTLLDQHLQISNLKLDMNRRYDMLNKICSGQEMLEPECYIIPIAQDFRVDIFRIDRDQLNNLPLPKIGREKFEEIRLKINVSDITYLNSLNAILELNVMKREIFDDNNKEDAMPRLFENLQKRFPERLIMLEDAMKKNKIALDEFQDELKKIFKNKFQRIEYEIISNDQEKLSVYL